MIEPSLKPVEVAVTPAKKEEGWWETIKVIIEALLIALVVRTVLFQPFNIPSGSLVPTLLVGDYLFVSKYAYGYSHFSLPSFLDLDPQAMPGRIFASEPKRGDIIVFKLPSDGQTDYIKRRRRVSLSARPERELHQADRRPARRQDPGPPWAAHYQRRGGPARAYRALSDRQSLQQADGGPAVPRDASRRGPA